MEKNVQAVRLYVNEKQADILIIHYMTLIINIKIIK